MKHLRLTWFLVLAVVAAVLHPAVALAASERWVPEFEGNEQYDRATLGAVLPPGTDPDPGVGDLVRKLRAFYVERGFLDAEVAAAPPEERGGKSILRFHIVEHARVTVAKRLYPCLKTDAIASLSEGGPRSPEAIGREIDSFLESELPGDDVLQVPDSSGLDATIRGPTGALAGTRVAPPRLDPDVVFAPDPYTHAMEHVQELYRNEGYLHAQVGPLRVLRRACGSFPHGVCRPREPASPVPDECVYDPAGLPASIPEPDDGSDLTCVPNAKTGTECEDAITLRIPIRLGPRTTLYDFAFGGVTAFDEARLVQGTGLVLGAPARHLALEDARRRVVELYKEEGYFFAEVEETLSFSPDLSRAAVRFDVREGPRVRVDGIVIRGNKRTSEGLIRRHVALAVGQPFRTSALHETEDELARLNLFSSQHVTLAEPQVAGQEKTVLITVVERNRTAHEVIAGVSSGDGVHAEYDFSHSNFFGTGIGLTARIRASYLPDVFLFDPGVKANFDTLCVACRDFTRERIAGMATTSLRFPELGLGPRVDWTLDGVAAHTLERDFVLTKLAAGPTIHYRPARGVEIELAQTSELNDTDIFGFATVAAFLQSQGQNSAELGSLLRIPDGESVAFAERLSISWDRRDNPLNPHRGFLLVGAVENTDWNGQANRAPLDAYGETSATPYGHTLRFSQAATGYYPLGKNVTLAGELLMGLNVQLDARSATYPDRLFFLGGPDSLRGYWQNSLVPQEDANRIAAGSYTINDVALRGGNVMLNSRLELRFPLLDPLGSALFFDTGNLWAPPDAPVASQNDALRDVATEFNLRTTGGTGLRLQTPVGPAALDLGLNLSLLASSSTDARRAYENQYAFSFAFGPF